MRRCLVPGKIQVKILLTKMPKTLPVIGLETEQSFANL